MKAYTVTIDSEGTIRWYKENTGILHREDGPAIQRTNGDKYWCLNGKWHREDGPAMIFSDGSKCWFINGVELKEAQFNARSH